MPRVFHSAIQRQTISASFFDFQMFLACKGHLEAKDREIAGVLATELATLAREEFPTPLRLLDVGTGEASVTEHTLSKLLELRPELTGRVSVDCVEPSALARQYCSDFAVRAERRAMKISCYRETFEQFAEHAPPCYDGIICCHTLYHFPPERVPAVIRAFLGLLAPRGILLLNLVSRTSDIYRLLDRLEPRLAEGRVARCFDAYGWLNFAEDLPAIMEALPVDIRKLVISAPVAFSQAEIDACRHGIEVGRGDQALVAQFLAFMYRVSPKDFVRVAPDLFDEVLNTDGGVAFKSVDYLFSVRRRGS